MRDRKDEPQFVRISEMRFWRGFHYAFAGILYAIRTQPNMRVHFIIAALVLLATLLLHLERIYIIAVVFAIVMVLAMELMNTAIEAVVDLFTETHHPLAKGAKDAAAGAVFVVSVGAIIVGYLAFYQGIQRGGPIVYRAIAQVPANVVVVMLALTLIATVLIKGLRGSDSMLQGGAVSGHTALASAAGSGLALIFQRPLVAVLAFLLVFLVGQSRIEARIHTTFEVLWGAVLGALVAVTVYLLVRQHLVL